MSDDQPIGALGGFPIRLAEFAGEDRAAYRRQYVPVKPSDRFVSGQQFEFTADLEFRDWVIDDFSGGIQPGPFWNPNRNGVVKMFAIHVRNDDATISRAYETTQISGGGGDMIGGLLFRANAGLWSGGGNDIEIRSWSASSSVWAATAKATGFPNLNYQILTAASPVVDEVYLISQFNTEIRKISNLSGATSNAQHFAAGSFGSGPVLVAYNGRLFVVSNGDLREIDQSTPDTSTLLTDFNGSRSPFPTHYRATISDVGPMWFAENSDGYTYVYEYNVASDTSARVARLPVAGVQPVSIRYLLGFTFVSYHLSPFFGGSPAIKGRGYIFWFRGSQSGTIGPVPFDGSYSLSNTLEARMGPFICGVVGNDLIVTSGRITLAAYDLSDGTWSGYGVSDSGGGATDQWSYMNDTPRLSAEAFGESLFITSDRTVSGADILRIIPDTWETRTQDQDTNLQTGRWHFGYPNVEKIFTTVTIDTNSITADDDIDLFYSVDGGAFVQATGTYSGVASTFTWTLSDSSTTVKGFDLDLRFDVSARSATNTNELTVYRIRSRATSAQSRRVWQIALDANLAGSEAGGTVIDHELLDNLNTLKANKAIVAFADPWQNRLEDGPETFDVIVEEVDTPALGESQQGQAIALVTLRESSLV